MSHHLCHRIRITQPITTHSIPTADQDAGTLRVDSDSDIGGPSHGGDTDFGSTSGGGGGRSSIGRVSIRLVSDDRNLFMATYKNRE